MIHHRELCNRRWVKLLCACRVSYEDAMNADRGDREERGESYWYRGRQWEEIVRFYQENGPEKNGDWSGVEIDEDLERHECHIRLNERFFPTKVFDKTKETLPNCRHVQIERPSMQWPAWRHVCLLPSQSRFSLTARPNTLANI